jgi:hypothetical protein
MYTVRKRLVHSAIPWHQPLLQPRRSDQGHDPREDLDMLDIGAIAVRAKVEAMNRVKHTADPSLPRERPLGLDRDQANRGPPSASTKLHGDPAP